MFKAFSQSKSLEVDELESDKLFQMNHMEFYEALGRVADKVSLSQHGREVNVC